MCGDTNPLHLTDEAVEPPTRGGLVKVGAAPRMFGGTFVVCRACCLAVTYVHWQHMRRKMTQAECTVMMKPLTSRMYFDDEPETNDCFAVIRAALTGEKP